MDKVYIKKIMIKEVRHLKDKEIPVSDDLKMIIFTGKNGSGKTSLLNALSDHIHYSVQDEMSTVEIRESVYGNLLEQRLKGHGKTGETGDRVDFSFITDYINEKEVQVEYNISKEELRSAFNRGEFITAYYGAERKIDTFIPRHTEKVILNDHYQIDDEPRKEFVKYILDMKMTEALAIASGREERAAEIKRWFEAFDHLLKKVFEDESTKLDFDPDTFEFHIIQAGKNPFAFDQLSDGFSSVIGIIVDLMMRMAKKTEGKFSFGLPGIVLIDEIETHLHLELQRNVMDLLTTVFPNIQFVVSTHSPFVLSCTKKAVIYDLETGVVIKEGLTALLDVFPRLRGYLD